MRFKNKGLNIFDLVVCAAVVFWAVMDRTESKNDILIRVLYMLGLFHSYIPFRFAFLNRNLCEYFRREQLALTHLSAHEYLFSFYRKHFYFIPFVFFVYLIAFFKLMIPEGGFFLDLDTYVYLSSCVIIFWLLNLYSIPWSLNELLKKPQSMSLGLMVSLRWSVYQFCIFTVLVLVASGIVYFLREMLQTVFSFYWDNMIYVLIGFLLTVLIWCSFFIYFIRWSWRLACSRYFWMDSSVRLARENINTFNAIKQVIRFKRVPSPIPAGFLVLLVCGILMSLFILSANYSKRYYPNFLISLQTNNKSRIAYLVGKGVDLNKRYPDIGMPINIAIQKCDVETVELLVNSGAEFEYSSFTLAVKRGDVDVFKKIVEYKGDTIVAQYNSPLGICLDYSSNNKQEMMQVLLDKGYDINTTKTWGEKTLLNIAVNSNDSQSVNFLLSKGINFDEQDSHKGSVIYDGYMTSSFTTFETLLGYIEDKNSTCTGGRTLLNHFVMHCGRQRLPVGDILLKHGADINLRDVADDELSPIETALKYKDIDLFFWLLERGADPTSSSSFGHSSIHYAAEGAMHERVIPKLIELGCDVNQTSFKNEKSPWNPIHYAVLSGNPETINLLIDHGAKIGIGENNKTSPLHLAANLGMVAIIELLLDLGTDVNLIDTFGDMPLIKAMARKENNVSIQFLIDEGADVNLFPEEGFHPAFAAIAYRNADALRLLIENGADFKDAIYRDFDALDLAEKIDDAEILKIVQEYLELE